MARKQCSMGWKWRPQTWQQDRPGLALLHRKHAGGPDGAGEGLARPHVMHSPGPGWIGEQEHLLGHFSLMSRQEGDAEPHDAIPFSYTGIPSVWM